MAMPEKGELPFYDSDEDETMSAEYRVEMYEAWAQNREPFRTGTRPEEGLPSSHFREGNRWETHGSRIRGLSRRTPLERTTTAAA